MSEYLVVQDVSAPRQNADLAATVATPLRLAIWFEIDPRSRVVGEGIALHTAMLLRAFAERHDVTVGFFAPSWSRHVVNDYFDKFKLRADNIQLNFVSSTLPPLDAWINFSVQADIRRETVDLDRPNITRTITESPWYTKTIMLLSPIMALVGIVVAPFALFFRLMLAVWRRIAGFALRPIASVLTFDQTYNMTKAINRSGAEVCFVPYVGWWRSFRIKVPIVAGVHDLVFVEFPNLFKPAEISELTRYCRRMAWRADAMFAISPRVLERHVVQYLGFDRNRTFLLEHAPLPVDQFLPKDADRGRSRLQQFMKVDIHSRRIQRSVMDNPYWRGWFNNPAIFDEPYIYYPTQYRAYKNIERLLYALVAINRSGRLAKPLRLVITADLSAHEKVMKLVNRLGLYEFVIPLLRLPADLHAAAYANAAVSISASEFEGGTPSPVSEGGSVGTPVILSRALYLDHFKSVSRLDQVTFEAKSITDLADKLLFAIEHREECLEINREMMACTAKRTWGDAAADLLKMCVFARDNPRLHTEEWRVRERNIADY